MIPERFRTIWGTRTFSTPCVTRRWRRTDLKTSGRIKCSAGYGVGSEILRKSKCKNHRNNACKVTARLIKHQHPIGGTHRVSHKLMIVPQHLLFIPHVITDKPLQPADVPPLDPQGHRFDRLAFKVTE